MILRNNEWLSDFSDGVRHAFNGNFWWFQTFYFSCLSHTAASPIKLTKLVPQFLSPDRICSL